jgi:hypothetical protein
MINLSFVMVCYIEIGFFDIFDGLVRLWILRVKNIWAMGHFRFNMTMELVFHDYG